MAMFSPAVCQLYPTALIRPAKFEPWVKSPLATIESFQLCAERFSCEETVNAGRPREVRA